MFKFIISIFLSLSITCASIGSLASVNSMKLRCFDLFADESVTKQKTSAPYYAEVLDFLNSKHNHFLFKNQLIDIVQPNLKNKSFTDNIKARYHARKLKKILTDLYRLDQSLNPKADGNFQTQIYNLEKIASNIEKLSFVMDDSQAKNMSIADRVAFKQVQHSLLTKGLSDFLFTKDIQISEITKSSIKDKILAPFKKIYLRWLISPVMMPRLDGAVIPFAVIEKVIWDGYDQSKHLLTPYLKTTHGKYAFNVFSTSYNWLITGVIVVSTVTWIHTATVETVRAYDRGVANAEAILKPVLENAKTLASKDLSEEFIIDTLQISIVKFQEKFQREPTPEEFEMIKQLIMAKQSAALKN